VVIFIPLLTLVLVKNIKKLKLLLLLQLLLFYGLSLPVTNHFLFRQLETSQALTVEQIKNTPADIIVVLAGGIKDYKKEYHGADISGFTLPRLRYAAYLQKRTGLPVLVAGGIEKDETTEAVLMYKVLREEYEVKARIYIENQSQNTFENASRVKKILKEHQFEHILLVSSAFHMPRALSAFENVEIVVTPAPTGFYSNSIDYEFGDFLPNSLALRQNYLALHEIIGAFWYRVKM
jgi:uncharacterized SAM-binding protein YcdF (DUF218 family)